ncbi:MAG: oxidoreductase [Sorangium cellulosum]|nr:MAG: oxidoreductase [Sorangium cellulosum]
MSLGTWGLSGDGYGPVSDGEASAVVERAVELGINLFETCDAYARGRMEERLGKLLENSQEQTFIVTRVGIDLANEVGPKKNFDPLYLREAVNRSGERLRRNRVDVVLLHNPRASIVEQGEATGVLEELREAGLIGAWGVSTGSREVAMAAVESGASVVSVAYNLFYSHDLHVIAAEVAMRGVAVLAHSVLAYGLLVSHWGPERAFDEGDHRRNRWTPALLRKRIKQLEVVRNLVGGKVLTPRAAALRFVLSNSLVTSSVLGPRSTAQLDQLIREAGSGPPYLPDKALADLPTQLISVGIHT